MDDEKAIEEFRTRLVNPLLEDVRRTLEVTCGRSGDDNHGSNFIGNTVVLMGIETIAQFINPVPQADIMRFKANANAEFASLEASQKTLLQARYIPSDVQGSALAKRFMKDYFNARFRRRDRILRVPLFEIIWRFRNPHAHAFYPFPESDIGSKRIRGAVDWLYKDSAHTGITIEEVESHFRKYWRKLYTVHGDWFRLCPQVLFVYFKKSIDTFIGAVKRDPDVGAIFVKNARELAVVYGFGKEDSP